MVLDTYVYQYQYKLATIPNHYCIGSHYNAAFPFWASIYSGGRTVKYEFVVVINTYLNLN